MTGCGCVLLVATLIALIAVLIFGSTDPGEPVAQIVALFLSWVAVRSMTSRARTPSRP